MDGGLKIIEPFEPDSVQPASVDLRLGEIRYEYDNLEKYTLGEKIAEEKIKKVRYNEYSLEHGAVAFVGIYEKITIPENVIGMIMPRSSITRLGIHIIPTYLNPGYSGYLPLTIVNHTGNRVTLKSGIRVVQLILFNLAENPSRSYKNGIDTKYYNDDVYASKLHADKELEEMLDGILEKEAPILHGMSKRSIHES